MTVLLTLIFSLLMFVSACEPGTDADGGITQLSVTEADAQLRSRDAQFIDVRTEEEYASGRALGAKNFPLDKLEDQMHDLDKSQPVYVICRTGRRSQEGSEILQKAGFEKIYNINGGTSEWIAAGLPTEK